MAAVATQYWLTQSASALLAGPLSATKVVLFTNNPTLNESTVIADLVQPTFTGYAAQTITFNPVYEDADGNIIMSSQELFFQPTAGTDLPQTVYGYGVVVTITAVDHLILAGLFDTPQVLETVLSAVAFVVNIILTWSANWGGTVPTTV